MKILHQYRSPNHTPVEISVDFAVLHFTATTLERTLEIFMDTGRKASAHLVIDRNGDVFEVVPCLESPALRAWHAGVSRLSVTQVLPGGPAGSVPSVVVQGFNDHSVGIELVNLNGNVFPYTDAQYSSLFECLFLLKGRYPALNHLSSVVGHENIAGFRGKSDPGRLFSWSRLAQSVYPGQVDVAREHRCTELLALKLTDLYEKMGASVDAATSEFNGPGLIRPETFEALSLVIEEALTVGV